jgi:hypothetical protein
MKTDAITVVSRGPGRLHVRVNDGVNTKDGARVFAAVRQLASAGKASEVMLDTSVVQEKLSVPQRLQLIMAFVTHLRDLRVAMVVSETTIDPKRLGETMARNRGANVKVFTNAPEALAWLRWNPPGQT